MPLLRAAAQGLDGAEPPRRADAGPDGRLATNGGSRLDRDLDGKIDDPGAAVMDGAWPKIADALMKPGLGSQLDELNTLFSRFDLPPGGQYSGWYQYFDRDIKRAARGAGPEPFENRYCGKGRLGACRTAIWEAIAAAGAELTADAGHRRPGALALRRDRRADRLRAAAAADDALHNRPSGIQQVISFKK